MIFQQACEAEAVVGSSRDTESAEFEQIASVLKGVRKIRTA
jgi:hypothetical protein